MDYEVLLDEADKKGLKVLEIPLTGSDGRIWRNRIAIRKDIDSYKEKACVLSEEISHFDFSCGDIMDESNVDNRKQEYIARLNSFNRHVGLIGLIKAFENGCLTFYDVADYLNVTERYLSDAIECYTEKYAPYITVDNYVIQFTPSLMIQKYFK